MPDKKTFHSKIEKDRFIFYHGDKVVDPNDQNSKYDRILDTHTKKDLDLREVITGLCQHIFKAVSIGVAIKVLKGDYDKDNCPLCVKDAIKEARGYSKIHNEIHFPDGDITSTLEVLEKLDNSYLQRMWLDWLEVTELLNYI